MARLPDSALIDQVEELVVIGVRPIAALAAQGVTERTYAEWTALAKSGGRGSRVCTELCDRIAQGEARFESIMIGRIRSASKDSWQAAAWLAERRFPDVYVRRSVNSEPAQNEPSADPFESLDPAPSADVVPLRRRDGA